MTQKEKYSKVLGKRIRSLRKIKNISIKEFETLQDSVDRHNLSKIETGKKTPTAYTLYLICHALKTNQSKLLDGIEKELEG
jgi:transcriptional regulator with XRE-family HTH domain